MLVLYFQDLIENSQGLSLGKLECRLRDKISGHRYVGR